MMDILMFGALTVTGFVACAEFGSYAFVHPVLRRELSPRDHVAVEKGLLGTFGRVMPVGMTLTVVLAVTLASARGGWATWAAVVTTAVALISTIAVNVPINRATGTWDADRPPPDWKATRNRWELFQGVRSWLLLAGFVLTCVAATT